VLPSADFDEGVVAALVALRRRVRRSDRRGAVQGLMEVAEQVDGVGECDGAVFVSGMSIRDCRLGLRQTCTMSYSILREPNSPSPFVSSLRIG
jgi:hypothetical protein